MFYADKEDVCQDNIIGPLGHSGSASTGDDMDIRTTLDLTASQPRFQGRILVVDDSPTNLLVFEHQLADFGFEVTTAGNGLEAVEMALSQSFDIILMDIVMPLMDGIEAIRRLRTENITVPVVALSGKNDPQDQEACLKSGFTAYLEKTFHEEELIDLLHQLLPTHNLTEQSLAHATNPPLTSNKSPETPIHIEWLWQIYKNADLINQILQVFIQDARVAIDHLENAINTNNEQDLKTWSHKLAGSAGVIRAQPLSEAARELEKAASDGDPILMSRLFHQVQQVYHTLSKCLADPTLLVRDESQR